MSTPWDDLAEPPVAVDPDPIFAARLRERLEAALLSPRRPAMTTTTDDSTPEHLDGLPLRPGDAGYLSLWTPDVERAVAFYTDVLGWDVARAGRHAMVPGLSLPQGIAALAETGGYGSAPTTFVAFAVPDVDAAVTTIRDAGGTAGEPTDEPYGRSTLCADDQGLPFSVHTPAEGLAPETAGPPRPLGSGVPGDSVYLTYEFPDTARARAFYGRLFGWEFTPGRVEDGWGPTGDPWPMLGFHGLAATGSVATAPRVVPMYQVADIVDAVARVRARGGRATDPQTQPYGQMSECVDDQDTRFYLGQI